MTGSPEHPVLLRTATVADVDAVHDLERRTFASDAWSRGTLLDEISGPHRHYVVLERDGAVCGYAGLLAVGSQGDVQTIAVDAASRGAGSGRLLLLELIAEAAERGVRELFLEVRADNPVARNLYDRSGFQQIAVRPRYYQPDGVDALVMRRAITPADRRKGD